MTSAQLPIDASSISNTVGIGVIERALKRLEAMLDGALERVCEKSDYAELREELEQLHRFARARQAMDLLADDTLGGEQIPPEFSGKCAALRREYSTILGSLDRMIRASESMAYLALEDQDVFFLRMREVITLIRRHEAEKDRLLDLAIWRETGGES